MDGAPEEQRAKPGTTAKAWSREGVEGCKVAEEMCEEKPWGRMQGQRAGVLWGTGGRPARWHQALEKPCLARSLLGL